MDTTQSIRVEHGAADAPVSAFPPQQSASDVSSGLAVEDLGENSSNFIASASSNDSTSGWSQKTVEMTTRRPEIADGEDKTLSSVTEDEIRFIGAILSEGTSRPEMDKLSSSGGSFDEFPKPKSEVVVSPRSISPIQVPNSLDSPSTLEQANTALPFHGLDVLSPTAGGISPLSGHGGITSPHQLASASDALKTPGSSFSINDAFFSTQDIYSYASYRPTSAPPIGEHVGGVPAMMFPPGAIMQGDSEEGDRNDMSFLYGDSHFQNPRNGPPYVSWGSVYDGMLDPSQYDGAFRSGAVPGSFPSKTEFTGQQRGSNAVDSSTGIRRLNSMSRINTNSSSGFESGSMSSKARDNVRNVNIPLSRGYPKGFPSSSSAEYSQTESSVGLNAAFEAAVSAAGGQSVGDSSLVSLHGDQYGAPIGPDLQRTASAGTLYETLINQDLASGMSHLQVEGGQRRRASTYFEGQEKEGSPSLRVNEGVKDYGGSSSSVGEQSAISPSGIYRARGVSVGEMVTSSSSVNSTPYTLIPGRRGSGSFDQQYYLQHPVSQSMGQNQQDQYSQMHQRLSPHYSMGESGAMNLNPGIDGGDSASANNILAGRRGSRTGMLKSVPDASGSPFDMNQRAIYENRGPFDMKYMGENQPGVNMDSASPGVYGLPSGGVIDEGIMKNGGARMMRVGSGQVRDLQADPMLNSRMGHDPRRNFVPNGEMLGVGQGREDFYHNDPRLVYGDDRRGGMNSMGHPTFTSPTAGYRPDYPGYYPGAMNVPHNGMVNAVGNHGATGGVAGHYYHHADAGMRSNSGRDFGMERDRLRRDSMEGRGPNRDMGMAHRPRNHRSASVGGNIGGRDRRVGANPNLHHHGRSGDRVLLTSHGSVGSGLSAHSLTAPGASQLAASSSMPQSSTAVTRSTLLEEFRAGNRATKWELEDLKGYVCEFSQDQHGSRFIQQKLETATDEQKELVFKEILKHAYDLMTDVFGNYVVQKFFDHGSPEQRRVLADQLEGRVLALAVQMYGCRVIQKALEVIQPAQQTKLVSELKGYVMKCVKDQNGNHVIQKCIEMVSWKREDPRSMSPNDIQFIVDAFENHVYMLSTHPYGCRVIQRVLEHCTEKQTDPILAEIHRCCHALVQDQYGNYVVQHVLEHGKDEDKQQLIDKMKLQVVQFSQHKFASNVVEKCLTYATEEQKNELISEMLGSDDDAISPLHVMMKDPYANYVVQKVIDVAQPSHRDAIVQRVKTQAPQLKRFTYGKHILTRLEKLTGQRLM